MKKLLVLLITLPLLFPPVTALSEVVFWFDQTETIYLTGTKTTITTINAIHNTLIAETTTAAVTSYGTITEETIKIEQKIMIGGTTVTRTKLFMLYYSRHPTHFEKLIKRTHETYTNTTITHFTTIEHYTIVDNIIGTQSIDRTISGTNTNTTTLFNQTYQDGVLMYAATSGAIYSRTVTLNLHSPHPAVGKIIIESNPYSTTLSAYLYALHSGTTIYFTAKGVNTFTAIVTADTTTFTLIGNQTKNTIIFSSYTVENNSTPTIAMGGECTLFNNPPHILYLKGNLPLIILPTAFSVTTLTKIHAILLSTNCPRTVFTDGQKIQTLPLFVPAFSLDAKTIKVESGTILAYGTLYYNISSKIVPTAIIFPNIYNAQDVYALINSIIDFMSSLTTYTLETVVLPQLAKQTTIDTTQKYFIINNNTYGTVQKISATLINNNKPTRVYEYTFAGTSIIETYYSGPMSIIYCTTFEAPKTITSLFSHTDETITITATTTSTKKGTYIIKTTTIFLKTTIAKPSKFSAIKSEVITSDSVISVEVTYTSPEITVLIVSETYTIIINLTVEENKQTIIRVKTTSQSGIFNFTTSTPPKEVQKTTINTLSIILYIVMGALTGNLLLSILCIIRADDDDKKKTCIKKLILTIVAIIVIFVMPRILD